MLKKISFVLMLECLFLNYSLNGQIEKPLRSQVVELEELEGKLEGLLTDVFVDSSNFVWILRGNDIVRFDGSHIQKYKSGEYTTSFYLKLFQDDFSRLWAISYSGDISYIQIRILNTSFILLDCLLIHHQELVQTIS